MWQHSKVVLLLLFFLITQQGFTRSDTSSINPIFRDSILRTQRDTVAWNSMIKHTNKFKKSTTLLIQKQKSEPPSIVFFYFALALLILVLIMRLVFEDFSLSMLEGLLSIKQYFVYYKSKKYDSLFALVMLYFLNIIILSMITYVGLQYFRGNNFRAFHLTFFIKIVSVIGGFFVIKDILEFLFNWVIDMQSIFRAYFLQLLFSEFIIAGFLLALILITVYNQQISTNFLGTLYLVSFLGYLVFNTIRSYQLMRNVQIAYKLHFFLYICAFKVMPLLLLAKYITYNVIA